MTNIETEITKLELALIPERDPRLKEPCTPWDFTKDGEPKELVLAMGSNDESYGTWIRTFC